MKVFTEETISGEGAPDVHLLMLTTKEAKVLVEAVEAACVANKRKASFKKLLALIERMSIY